MRRRVYYISGIIVILVGVVVGLVLIYYQPSLSKPKEDSQFISVPRFGPLVLGGKIPYGEGGWTFAPYNEIPKAKFYINIVQKELWCIFVSCGSHGAYVQTMGGWLQGEELWQPEVKNSFGFTPLIEDAGVVSIAVVADQDSRIVGIYPNATIDNLIDILLLHPDLADFSRLAGVFEFGPLKVGDVAPLKPGDPTSYDQKKLSSFPVTNIPQDKKFYVYVMEQDLFGHGYCAFHECSQPGYFDFVYVDELGGWFSNDSKPETAKKFGLDPEKVAAGESSLVVVTDPQARIVAIHPGKTRKDILTILRQLPQLVDFTKFDGG